MKPAAAQTPRLKNLDELFRLNDGINPLDQLGKSRNQPAEGKRTQSTIAIEMLTPFPGHPFRLYEGERLEDMVHSIKKNGILVPIIVRRKGDVYEILSGHNRVNAAKLAGLERMPVIALENISDDEAWVYVVETNLMQRSFSDMAHSEKAAVIAAQHYKLFSQGKRNSILEELKLLENPHDLKENETCAQVGTPIKSRDIVAREYSLSRNTVARYLRIHQLIESLKIRLDKEEIPFIPAVSLSFLRENEQELLDKCIGLNTFKVDMKKAELLRQYSELGKLDDDMYTLSYREKSTGLETSGAATLLKSSPKFLENILLIGKKPPEVEAVIEKALDFYFQHKEGAE